MTAALRCDGPDCPELVVDPERAVRWWRLERNGANIDVPEIPGEIPQMRLMTGGLEVHLHGDEDEEVAAPELGEEDLDPAVLHFHAARCLAGWADMAAALGEE
ncbi:MAG TPA: hypothetical protein VMW08_00415 [Acidimicrobiales bacterium]|nr:hypothetical protein [Acidimicrobiales bacterium]